MKVLPFFAVCGTVALMSVAASSTSQTHSSVCQYQPVTEFNPKLPASHIQNQCARHMEGVEEVSWFSWIAGKSPSFQFHFLDLLELLHNDDSSVDFTSSPNDA
ncbi:hypothetical protein [Alteromonas gracilis]|uniref:hypothetical protein n=1 Tax=Alteromonas gracilis TaxID=1479524 RepID=UPI0030CC015E